MRNPRIGDLVLEVSTIWLHPGKHDLNRLGRLERHCDEPAIREDEREDYGYGPEDALPTEEVWYLRTLDGREYRWTNARFIAVPERLVVFHQAPAGQAFGKG